MMNSWDE
jgi:hypothetical protein